MQKLVQNPLKPQVLQTNDDNQVNQNTEEDDEDDTNNSLLYSWSEFPELKTTFIAIRKAPGIKYSMKATNTAIELQMKGSYLEEDYEGFSKSCKIPLQMIKHNFQDWLKTAVIKLKHPVRADPTEVWKSDSLIVYSFSMSTGDAFVSF